MTTFESMKRAPNAEVAEKVAQPLLAVRFSQLSRAHGAIHRENRTARRSCATDKVGPGIRGLRLAAFFTGLAGVLLIFCGAIEAQTGATIPAARELTDEVGRRVRVPGEAARVVSLAPNLTEIVFALGEEKHLAGDTDYCDYPAEATQKPHVGGTINPNLEEVVALKPDLVLATKSINRRETVDALDHIGLPVFVTDPHSVEGMISSVEHIGAAMGAEKSAAVLVEDLRGRLAGLNRRLVGDAQRRVLFVVWTDPLISVGRNTFIADALRLAGGRSVVETDTEWPHVSMEEMLRLQPEFLVFASDHDTRTQHDIDELRARPGWKDLEAMQNGKIVILSDAINRPAPRMVDAIEQLARALHPEAFALHAAPSEESGAGFSLRGLALASSKIHRLKPAPRLLDPNALLEEACLCNR